jgi:hypothetical protein
MPDRLSLKFLAVGQEDVAQELGRRADLRRHTIGLERPAALVDEEIARPHQRGVGMSLGLGQDAREEVRGEGIVIADDHAPLAPCKLQEVVQLRGQAESRLVLDIGDQGRVVGIDDEPNGVVVRIVVDDDLDVLVRLVEAALQALTDIRRAPESRNTDRNEIAVV